MIALQVIDIASNPVNKYVYLSIILFSIGVMGVLMRRNAIIILMCIELMLNAANLLLVAFSAYNGQAEGQMVVFFVIVVAAAEVAVGLALLISIYRNISSTDINLLNRMKG
jgi:NADH-quinone oxidoreductase subunit K